MMAITGCRYCSKQHTPIGSTTVTVIYKTSKMCSTCVRCHVDETYMNFCSERCFIQFYNKQNTDFIERILNPSDLGHAVTAEVRDEARVILGMKPVESNIKSEPQSSDIQFNPKKYKLAYMRDLDMQEEEADDGCEYYTLGILDENGEFQDFYYDSGMEFDEFRDLIPKGFGEAMESCYQFKQRSNKGKTAKEVLENHGYVEVKE